MYERNIPRAMTGAQAQKQTKPVHLQEKDIYCPMCEVWHANNSWCQAPVATMEGH